MTSFDNPSIKITGILFQNNHGSKYYANYYLNSKDPKADIDLSVQSGQNKFQQGLLNKVQRMNIIATMRPELTQIFTYMGYTILFKVIDELQIFLIVCEDENYVLMEDVINVIGEVLLMITKGPYAGKLIFDYLQDIALVADQIIHSGYIVCLDSEKIYGRLKMKDSKSDSALKPEQKKEVPQQQQQGSGTFSSIFGFAKNTFSRTLNLG